MTDQTRNRIGVLSLAVLLSLAAGAAAQDSFGGSQQQQQQQYPPPQGQQQPYQQQGQQQPYQQGQQQGPQQPYQQQGGYQQQGPQQGGYQQQGQQQYPPQGYQQPPPQSGPQGFGAPSASGSPSSADALAQLTQMERQDMGVAPMAQLKSDAMHAPTPASIPGGRLVTTAELVQLMQDRNSGVLVFDILGGQQTLPNAIPAVRASQGGSFQDAIQQEFGNYLQQATGGRKDRPLVFYCQGVQCWMSYNAALRAINLGYTKVLWYRGGLEAWQQAGLPTGTPGGR